MKRKKTRTPTKRTKTTRTGSKLVAVAAAIVLSAPLAIVVQKRKSERPRLLLALIAGTVYRPPGFALPGVEVIVAPEQAEARCCQIEESQKQLPMRVVSLPCACPLYPQNGEWTSTLKGIVRSRSLSRSTGEQRVDLSIILEPARQAQGDELNEKAFNRVVAASVSQPV